MQTKQRINTDQTNHKICISTVHSEVRGNGAVCGRAVNVLSKNKIKLSTNTIYL